MMRKPCRKRSMIVDTVNEFVSGTLGLFVGKSCWWASAGEKTVKPG